MLGAIAGDIIGSVYEWNNVKTTDFPLFTKNSRFTDDTVLTAAVADSILSNRPYKEKLKEYFHYYPEAGYGNGFRIWASSSNSKPYNSWGNGSAMRVSPIGFAFKNLEDVLTEAKKSAIVTHNHPEGIKGAQATASAVFLSKQGKSKKYIKTFIENLFGYNLDVPIETLRQNYKYDVSCQGSVPQAITVFLQSEDYEDAVRKAISIGGDSDTIACITGGIAHAYYNKIPDYIVNKAREILDNRLNQIVDSFTETFL